MDINRITIENNVELLRKSSTDVNFLTDNYLDYIDKLKKYCKNDSVYALASVQIGIPKRIIYLKNTTPSMDKNINSDYDESLVIINPVILNAKGHTRFLERCASCLDYVAIVDRPYSVEVEYYDINSNKVHEIFEGFKSTVFCHEYDHLNGILHIDLSNDIRNMTWEETRDYREKNPYEILSKDDKYDFNLRKVIIKK
ncbi:MAG: peptide deformylase [Clostridia bacterium]|nr:peptide deformylase [Clostridia bacterium]